MSLDSGLSIASSALFNINAQFAVVSQNVANAATPGYSTEVGHQENLIVADAGAGVKADPATLQVDQALQASVVQQNALVSGGKTTQTALQAIDSVLGTPGSGNDLGTLLGKLQDSFSTLLTDPSNQTQQDRVVSQATTLAQGINSLSAAYTAQRQAAQNNMQSEVNTLNTTLGTISTISQKIVALGPTNQSTADLENQRNAAVQTLSQLLDVRTTVQSNGDMTVFTPSGLTLASSAGAGTFAVQNATADPGTYYPGGGLPGITLNGVDVTGQVLGGQIGANVTLRDTTLPTDQAALDELSQGLASRFAAQGLSLFTDGSGNVPSSGGTPVQSGYVGFSAAIQVNSAVAADPSLVRDGNLTTSTFTPNPTNGPAGFTTLISNIINYTFGRQSQSGVSQPALNTSGLGPTGNLTAPFTDANDSLATFTTSLIASQAQQSSTTTDNVTTSQALQTSLNARVSAVSGVNTDSEMSHMLSLQNSYSANARVITAAQSMYTQLLQAVQ